MSKASVELCKSLVTEISGGTWSKTLDSVVRGYIPQVDAKDLDENPRISVAPSSSERDRITRGSIFDSVEVIVVIQAKLGTGIHTTTDRGSLTEIDALMAFSEEVVDHFLGDIGTLELSAGGYHFCCNQVRTDPLYDFDKAQRGVYESIIEVTFEVVT